MLSLASSAVSNGRCALAGVLAVECEVLVLCLECVFGTIEFASIGSVEGIEGILSEDTVDRSGKGGSVVGFGLGLL